MKFLLVMEQDNGCDYTIGCGTVLMEIEASSRLTAITVAFEKMADDYGGCAHITEDINRASLYEICGGKMIMPLDEFRQEMARQEEDIRLAKECEAERQQYLRLKTKYEKEERPE